MFVLSRKCILSCFKLILFGLDLRLANKHHIISYQMPPVYRPGTDEWCGWPVNAPKIEPQFQDYEFGISHYTVLHPQCCTVNCYVSNDANKLCFRAQVCAGQKTMCHLIRGHGSLEATHSTVAFEPSNPHLNQLTNELFQLTVARGRLQLRLVLSGRVGSRDK